MTKEQKEYKKSMELYLKNVENSIEGSHATIEHLRRSLGYEVKYLKRLKENAKIAYQQIKGIK